MGGRLPIHGRDHRPGGADPIPSLAAAPGNSVLVYRYTITGTAKASIDTGVDTPDAGTNDWTNGDVIEAWMVVQTTELAVFSTVGIQVNNDTGSNYDRATVQSVGGTASGNALAGAESWTVNAHGNASSTFYPSVLRCTIPDYTGTVFWKSAELLEGLLDANTADQTVAARMVGYRSQSAISRLKVFSGSGDLAVGSQLIIWKRQS